MRPKRQVLFAENAMCQPWGKPKAQMRGAHINECGVFCERYSFMVFDVDSRCECHDRCKLFYPIIPKVRTAFDAAAVALAEQKIERGQLFGETLKAKTEAILWCAGKLLTG